MAELRGTQCKSFRTSSWPQDHIVLGTFSWAETPPKAGQAGLENALRKLFGSIGVIDVGH